MAETRPRFGKQSSADVTLFLTGPGDKRYGKNPVYLHSQILRRLKGFEGKFSNRWSPVNIAAELWVTTSHNFGHYLKCIEIMYGEHVDFPNIEEYLAILTIASEMSGDECINKCMDYLEAVRWSAEESQIRKVLSSDGLELKISADLAARLHQDQDGDDRNHISFVEKIIQEMVSLVTSTCSTLSRNRETAEKDLREILEGNTSRDVLDVCGRVLLQEFKTSVDSRNLSTLKLIFNLIQHCKGAILEAALKLFCEDAEFINFLKKEICTPIFFTRISSDELEGVIDMVDWFMTTGDGKIIIPRVSRMSLLTTWLPIVGKFRYNGSLTHKSEQRDKAVLSVVESLPQVDQKHICVIWAKVYRLNKIDIATPFTLS